MEQAKLEGTWTLKTLGATDVSQVAEPPQLTITADNKVSGSTGINRLSGSLAEGDKLFGVLAMTRRAGPPAAMKLEHEFTQALGQVDAYEVEATELRLLAGGEVLLVFEGDEQ